MTGLLSDLEDFMRVRRMSVDRGKAIGIGRYPNFHYTGSVIGMKRLYYGEDALLVRCGSWIYNVPENIYYLAD